MLWHDAVARGGGADSVVMVNPHRVSAAQLARRVPPPGGEAANVFHRSLPGYAPTPLRHLAGFAAEIGVASVAAKDESSRLGLPSFKILGASWAVERALRQRPDLATLVAASAGNHGRAVAHCAAQRGLAARIYLPVAASPQRVKAIANEGAQVVSVDGDYDAAVAAACAEAQRPGHVLIADTAEAADAPSPRWVMEGYTTLFRELAVAEPADVLFVPIGVGSLAAAAVRWAVHESPATLVIGVEPVTAACVTASLRAGDRVTVPTPGTSMSGLDCATPSAVAWPTLRDGLAGTVTVTDAETHDAMRELGRRGLMVGECGAAALAALRSLAAKEGPPPGGKLHIGASTRVLILATEGPTDPASYRRVMSAA